MAAAHDQSPTAVCRDIAVRQNKSAVVAPNLVREPCSPRFGADHDEHGRGRDLLLPARSDVFQHQSLESRLAVAVDHLGAQPDGDVGVASICWIR